MRLCMQSVLAFFSCRWCRGSTRCSSLCFFFVLLNTVRLLTLWNGIAVPCQTKFMFAHQRCRAKTKNRLLCKVDATRVKRFYQFIHYFVVFFLSALAALTVVILLFRNMASPTDCTVTNRTSVTAKLATTTTQANKNYNALEMGSLKMDSIIVDKLSIAIMARQLNNYRRTRNSSSLADLTVVGNVSDLKCRIMTNEWKLLSESCNNFHVNTFILFDAIASGFSTDLNLIWNWWTCLHRFQFEYNRTILYDRTI